ncbi:MAG: threonylcarbamoyl-AMP synthase, partial [Myxococcales bacterium]|nr:threonylcarbamoyl-AMP synthase [Myxococcales bacterium]
IVSALRAGSVVAIPTETVYGLGADGLNEDAVARIFAIKGRPSNNPLILHAADVEHAKSLVAQWPAAAEELAARFWPGPLTLVLPRRSHVPAAVTAGLETVAVRVPSHPVMQALIRRCGSPIAAPSANPYMGVSPTRASHVLRSLGDKLDWIVDGGPTTFGIESTVVGLHGTPTLFRRGSISESALRESLPDLAVNGEADSEQPMASPGLAKRHYSPRAQLFIAQDAPLDCPLPIGRISRGPTDDGNGLTISLPDEPQGYAAGLFSALHELDALGCETILVEPPPSDESWAAIWDRLERAAYR